MLDLSNIVEKIVDFNFFLSKEKFFYKANHPEAHISANRSRLSITIEHESHLHPCHFRKRINISPQSIFQIWESFKIVFPEKEHASALSLIYAFPAQKRN